MVYIGVVNQKKKKTINCKSDLHVKKNQGTPMTQGWCDYLGGRPPQYLRSRFFFFFLIIQFQLEHVFSLN